MTRTNREIRLAAFAWLEARVVELGRVLPRELLEAGMTLDGIRVPFLGPQGIFKPRVLTDAPLSVTTSPNSPYKDAMVGDDMILYKYRGENSEHHENVGLRRAYKEAIPLVYFKGLVPGKYFAAWPVFIVADNPTALTFTIQVDEPQSALYAMPTHSNSGVNSDGAAPRRSYVTAQVLRRVHQQSFRERVLAAYCEQCAICRLRHPELLDAAHIIGDKEDDGEPIVENGLSLCKLHHAAFDRNFFGIRADKVVEVRASILAESDGPMLQHGLKAIHGIQISVPAKASLRPDPERLDIRYKMFLSA